MKISTLIVFVFFVFIREINDDIKWYKNYNIRWNEKKNHELRKQDEKPFCIMKKINKNSFFEMRWFIKRQEIQRVTLAIWSNY